jgi:hypothetical protein
MTQFTCKGVKQINNRISFNMIFTFTIRISRRFSSARKFQMGNFQKYWSQKVGQDFFVLDFFHGRKAAIKNSYKPLCKHESDNLWCRGKFLISIKRAMNSSRIELLWLVWDQSRSKYYFRTKFQDRIDKPQKYNIGHIKYYVCTICFFII